MNIDFCEFTSVGLVRTANQDSIFAKALNEYGLFAVADGMGGHYKGELASGRLISSLENWWEGFAGSIYPFEKCYEDIRQLLQEVNKSIYTEFTCQGKICGTTVGLLFIYSDKYLLINSGDTRIYSLRGLKIKQESTDHTFGNEAVISGSHSMSEIDSSPDKNKLTAAVGSKKELKMYITSAPIRTKRFFICSDGVYKYCSPADIKSALIRKNTREIISKRVERNGARDNYSFIKIKINM